MDTAPFWIKPFLVVVAIMCVGWYWDAYGGFDNDKPSNNEDTEA